jgi:two-component system, chemotaxis family, CheB/CheR fusion protein
MKAASTSKKSPEKFDKKEGTFPVVAIGASAGGLEAMMEFLKYLPADTGMAFIYVQHLSPDHKSLLTEILSKKTKMVVQEIDDMDKINPNNVFVIPYNKGIEVIDGHIKLIPRSESSAAISIDILFSSLAEAQKERVIGIILSGSASDGTEGMKAIKQFGGLTFAQDDSAKFTSMPHSAIAAGTVDFILSTKDMALELARLSKQPLGNNRGVKNGDEDLIDNNDPELINILNQLHISTGVDFSVYKMNTIKRRIIRRMFLYKISLLKEYAKLLTENKEEIDILYQDLLINVTSFFRDTETHEYLRETLFPKLLQRKKNGDYLRLWVPACATGEEAYSLAIMLLEIQESKITNIPVQIFATDLSDHAIGKARIGIYTQQELETVSPRRIQRFFTKTEGGFRVNKAVRDMCVFAQHNILRDPPFSRLDFISCCNLFIYFDITAQKKAVNTFHYALNDDGFLMLGKSENISHSPNLFIGFNKKYKIFSRKINAGTRTLPVLLPRYAQQNFADKPNSVSNKNKLNQNISVGFRGLDHAIDTVLVSEFMPASVVITHQMEIIQFRGITDLFLTHPKGKATFNILKMARPEIAFELRNSISKVIKSNMRVRKSGIELKLHGEVKIISIEIVPLQIEFEEPLILVLFNEHEQIAVFSNNEKGERDFSLAKDRRILKLEQELAAAHADTLMFAQEQEEFTEELQSANEEVVSSNEELQSVNEELETSKEEIESANEELTTTNQELQTRNDLLFEAYEYSEAVFATIHESMIVLDKNLRVKSANKTFYKVFNVKKEDTEGLLLYELGNKQWDIERLRKLLEDILPGNKHFHDFEITHTFPLIGKKTMLLNARRIVQKMNHEELILLAISDISEQTIALKKIEQSEQRFRNLVEQTIYPILILKGDKLILELANDPLFKIWHVGKESLGKPFLEILPEMKDQPFYNLLLDVYKNNTTHFGNEQPAHFKRENGQIETLYFNFVYQPYKEEDGKVSGVIAFASDVTEQVLARLKMEENEKELLQAKEFAENAVKFKQQFLSNMSHEIRTPLNSILGFANVLLKTDLEESQKEFLEAIKTSGHSLNLLINDILDLAKVNAGRMKFDMQPFEIRSSIKSILFSFDFKIKEKNLKLLTEFDSKIPAKIVGDSVRLNQIILNLVGNAVKFTNVGRIKLKVTLLNETDDNLNIQFSISDSGIGIKSDKINSIFNLFEQAEISTANSYGGTGLGLAIVKQLIENQGGRICVKSEINVGSTFSFVLPFAKKSIQSESKIEIPKQEFEVVKLRILVAEDVVLNQLLIRIILDDFGFEHEIVGNGKLAIEAMQNNDYDIVLMDLQMPIMNGFEATEFIRKTLKSKIPIIALTADVTTIDEVKCKKIGMNGYISKPIDEHLLYRKIVELTKVQK